MIRNLVSKFSKIVAERSHSTRRQFELPIKVSFEEVKKPSAAPNTTKGLFLTGETYDLSGSGIAFMVSAIRVKDHYLVGQERPLLAEIDIPGGKVRMTVIGRRYEKVGQHLSMEKYVIGAEITSMEANDRERYEYFLKFGRKGTKSSARSLELGVD